MFHPARGLDALKGIAASLTIWATRTQGAPAATNGRFTWITPDMTNDEKYCALVHESVHRERGHTSCQPPAVERDVRLEAARRLIPYEKLRQVAGWATCPADMAEELGVIEEVVIDRLVTLDGDQVTELWPPSEHIA